MYFSGYLKCGKATTKTDQNMTIFQFLKVVRKTFLTPLKVRKSYSQCAEDLIVDDLLKSSIKSGADGFYVDIGWSPPEARIKYLPFIQVRLERHLSRYGG